MKGACKETMKFIGERFIPGLCNEELASEHLNRYRFAAALVKGLRVLDIACGSGYGSMILQESAASVDGVDISEEAVAYCRETYQKAAVRFHVGSVDAIPLPDQSVDAVVSFETLEHVSAKTQLDFMKEIRRVLVPGGLLVISTPNKAVYDHRGENEFHVHELEADDFSALLKENFHFVEVFGQLSEICNLIVTNQSELSQVSEGPEIQQCEYLLAVCSDHTVPAAPQTVQPRCDEPLKKLMSWARENNQRIEELSAWGQGLDKEVAERDATIADLNKQIEELSAWGQGLDKIIAEREATIQKLTAEKEKLEETQREVERQMLEELQRANALNATQRVEIEHQKNQLEALKNEIDEHNKQIEHLKAEIKHHKGHAEALEHVVDERNETIEALKNESDQLQNQVNYLTVKRDVLLEREKLLHEIEGSKAYRLTRVMQKFSGKVMPVGSKRRKMVGSVYRFVRHPAAVIKSKRPDKAVVSSDKLADYAPLVFPVHGNPRVSIIIPVYNQFGYTYNCLKSILENTQDVSYEIIIGNDCSTDLTAKIQKIVSNIRVVTNKTNLRFLRNCNHAASFAKGEFIFFLNNDTQVHANWLSSLVELMDKDESIGMCGSKLVYENGQLQEAGGILWRDGSAWNYGKLQDPDAPEYSYVKDVDYISGAAILIRTALWKEIGGFDELFAPAYNEDSDLAFEVRKRGKRVVLQPASVVTHFEGISNGTDTSTGQKAYQIENARKFYLKWKDVLEQEHFNNAENVFLARDRSKGKKTILVIDHYVPQFDKDAGSRTVFAYLKLFVKQGMNVKFIGDNYYRHEPYTTVLQQMGVEVLYGPWYAQHWEEWLRENGQYIDYVMMNRPHISVKYIDSLRVLTNAKLFYYGHDLHFLRERRRYETTKDPEAMTSAAQWLEKETQLMHKADESWYPSQVEVDEIKKNDSQIRVRAIPAYLFESSDPVTYNACERKDVMFVGGFGHGPNVDAVKWFHDEIWPAVHAKNPGIKAYIIGSSPPDEVKAMNNKNFVVVGAVSDEELAAYYHKCRMTVVPLRFGAGIKGKVVEAMYHRLPILTTSVGAEGINFADESIVVRDNPQAFAGKLTKLYSDEETLNSMSKAYEQYIRRTYSFEYASKTLAPEFDQWEKANR